MSGEIAVGKRYAKALFELALEQNRLDEVTEQLRMAANVLSEPEASAFFRHPSIGEETKRAVLDKALGGKVSDLLLRTLHLLVERGRISALDALVKHVERLADEHAGRVTAIVYTPVPLTEQQEQEIAGHFAKKTGKQVRVQNEINKELLGGMQVKIGDRVYDASLSSKLARLKKQLA